MDHRHLNFISEADAQTSSASGNSIIKKLQKYSSTIAGAATLAIASVACSPPPNTLKQNDPSGLVADNANKRVDQAPDKPNKYVKVIDLQSYKEVDYQNTYLFHLLQARGAFRDSNEITVKNFKGKIDARITSEGKMYLASDVEFVDSGINISTRILAKLLDEISDPREQGKTHIRSVDVLGQGQPEEIHAEFKNLINMGLFKHGHVVEIPKYPCRKIDQNKDINSDELFYSGTGDLTINRDGILTIKSAGNICYPVNILPRVMYSLKLMLLSERN